MSKSADKLYRMTLAAIQRDYGIAKSGGESSAAIMELCKAATRDRFSRKLARLERIVHALAESEAPPLPKAAHGFADLDATQWVTSLNRATPPLLVNGFDHKREVSHGQAPQGHPER